MSKAKPAEPQVAELRVLVAHDHHARNEIINAEMDERTRALIDAGYLRPTWTGEAEAAARGWPAGTLVRGPDPRPTSTAATRTTTTGGSRSGGGTADNATDG